MDRADAERKLRGELDPRLGRALSLKIGDADETLDPTNAGLHLDWPATLDRAGSQPLNPITRLTSFFSNREVGVATRTDDGALTAAMEALRVKSNREPAEGTIRFEGATPVAVEPKSGQALDVEAARRLVVDNWAAGAPITLPVHLTPVKTTPEGIRNALEQLAKPAVSGPEIGRAHV